MEMLRRWGNEATRTMLVACRKGWELGLRVWKAGIVMILLLGMQAMRCWWGLAQVISLLEDGIIAVSGYGVERLQARRERLQVYGAIRRLVQGLQLWGLQGSEVVNGDLRVHGQPFCNVGRCQART